MSGYKYPDLVPDNELASSVDAATVTPSDTVDLDYTARSLYIGTTGDLAVTLRNMAAGTKIIYKNMPVGFAPVSVSRVWTTGTSASNIIANF
jgi:hypothetical protein